jgi:hypothetical protein
MNPFRLSFSFLLLLLTLSHSGADERSTDVKSGFKPFPSSTPQAMTKYRIAFLVGINSYKATTSLKYAVGDSEAIEDLLLKTGKYDKLIKLNDYGKITTILNPETQVYSSQRIKMAPTKANIEETYQEILAENPDTLLFYYSGHGFIEGEGGENFIAPKDVDVKFEKQKVGKVEKEVPIPLNGISLKVMGIQASKVKRVVFLIDACRSPLPEAEGNKIQIADAGKKEITAKSTKNEKEDKSKDGDLTSKEILLKQNILSVRTDKLPKRVLEAEGITMLIGAAPEVSSLEDEDFKSGIFTHFLKKAFNGGVQEENQEEYITEENLSRYIEDRFKHYYELRKKETESAAEPKLYNLTFDRGKKGELLLTHHRPIEGKERIDKPIYTDKIRKREVRGKLVYNEKGLREDLRFFVHDKKRDLYFPDSLDGVYKMKYSFTKDKSGELENFTATEFNLENEEVFEYGTRLIPDVGWEYRGLYNNNVDVETGLRPVSTSMVSTSMVSTSMVSTSMVSTSMEKIRFEQKIYDFNGNVISEEYFDDKGKPLEFDGVAKIVRAYDKYGQIILEEFYSKETYDEYGDVVEQGKLIAKDGFARYRAKYKSKGNLLLETWEDEEGKNVNNQYGYAKTKYIYDKNERLIQKKFYDLENKAANDKWGVSVYSYSYNSDCFKFYETKIAEITKKENKTALEDWKLGKYRLCLTEEIHTDKEGNPADDEKKIYKKVRTFNKKGYLTSEEYFRADGRRHLENGVAKIKYLQDNQGNIISRKNFGEFEVNKIPVPISDGDGVHEYRYTYLEYFSYDNKPILNECMYHRKEKGIIIEPYGCASKIEHFGIDGNPIENQKNIFRTNIYYTGAYQKEADKHYYRLGSEFIYRENKVDKTFNPFGNLALNSYFENKNGKEVLIWKEEFKYDEKNNMTQYAKFETIDGLEILSIKPEYKYDSNSNQIQEVFYEAKPKKLELTWITKSSFDNKNNNLSYAYYEISGGKDILIWIEKYEYDKRNNLTLSSRYETKDGKEILIWKIKRKYDEKNNLTFDLYYGLENEKIVPIEKIESKYYNKNNIMHLTTEVMHFKFKDGKWDLIERFLSDYDANHNLVQETKYNLKEGLLALQSKVQYKYDEKNNNILKSYYVMNGEKEILDERTEYKYDEKNRKIFWANYKTQNGKEFLTWEMIEEYDEIDNKILESKFDEKKGKEIQVWNYNEKNNSVHFFKYEGKDEKKMLISREEYHYDERKNKILDIQYNSEDIILKKNVYDYRSASYTSVILQYLSKIKSTEELLVKLNLDNDPKKESEKKSLTQKLEDLQKEFEAKKKKFTLTEETFGANEKLEYSTYKLLFFNPRGPVEKRLMRVDLDQFYRPLKVGFEEE